MAFQSSCGQRLAISALPDITHNATTVTECVSVEEQDRKFRENPGTRIHARGQRRWGWGGSRFYLVEQHRTSLLPRRSLPGPRTCSAEAKSAGIGARNQR